MGSDVAGFNWVDVAVGADHVVQRSTHNLLILHKREKNKYFRRVDKRLYWK